MKKNLLNHSMLTKEVNRKEFIAILAGVGLAVTGVSALAKSTGIVSSAGKGWDINVKDHGALGDGSTDDTKAISDAFTALPSNGGSIYFPSGTYIVSGPVTINFNNVHVLGAGPASIIKIKDQTNIGYVFYIAGDVQNVEIDQLTIDGNKTNQTGGTGLIVLQHSATQTMKNVNLHHLRLINSFADAIHDSSANATLTGLTIADNYFGDIGATPNGSAISLGYVSGVTIHNNIILNCYAACIASTHTVDGTITGNVVMTNTIGAGIDIGDAKRVSVTGNYLYDVKNGLWCETSTSQATLSGNVVIGKGVGSEGQGVTLGRASGASPSRVIVSNNYIASFGWAGVYSSGGLTKCQITNNIIELCGQEGMLIGSPGSTPANADLDLSHNQIFNCSASKADAYDGMWLQSLTGGRIVGNRISGSYQTGIRDGTGGAGAPDNNIISLNDVRGSSDKYPISSSGANTIVRNNLGYRTEAKGTGTIAKGFTAVSVNHGLFKTPAVANISITPTNNPTADPGNIWVSIVSPTVFNVHCRNNPGDSGLNFAWQASVI